jgi:hypothetical protein
MTSDIVALKDIDNPQGFYVYVHLRADTLEPFYVGKGSGRRAWDAGPSKRERWWRSVKAKHGCVVKILQDGLQEWASLELEQETIALIGRKDIGQGPLVNMSDGGSFGATGIKRSDKTKEKLSAAARARWSETESGRKLQSENAKKNWANPNRRKMQSDFAKKQWADAPDAVKAQAAARAKARWQDKEYRHKVLSKAKETYRTEEGKKAIAKRAATHYVAVVCNGFLHFESLVSAIEWIRSKPNGHKKAHASSISSCLTGRHKTAYGYRWAYADNPAPL